ncbi:hypothetical protein OHV05_26955 [Kitasatospora sp. NBC_00070]|uniref:hypothetical protein n=1 Tax=Kitasatospora sp. NBC_00070 TaxID=2975962 RepID=UPI003255F4AC
MLELLEEGATPYDAVTGLVRHAMRVADGILPDPEAFREQLEEAQELLAEYDDEDEEMELAGLRITPLDPQRPARDLLEDLLAGIQGCWILHDEYAEPDEDEDEGDGLDEEDWDDEQAERHQDRSRGTFAALVRAIAARDRDRLI